MARLCNKIMRELLLSFSELEARISEPTDRLYFRRLYLRFQRVRHGRDIWIGRGLRLNYPGNLILGERCAIGAYSIIANHGPITIGDDFISAPRLVLDSGTHDPLTMRPGPKPIKIGNRVWCGLNVTVLAGVTIGDDVVLGAGSVVCRDIPSGSIAAGVPAKIIKQLRRDPEQPFWRLWAISERD
jgi:maltose O-acetyltransferase